MEARYCNYIHRNDVLTCTDKQQTNESSHPQALRARSALVVMWIVGEFLVVGEEWALSEIIYPEGELEFHNCDSDCLSLDSRSLSRQDAFYIALQV